MPSIPLHPRASSRDEAHNPLPQLLQTPSGLALLELQGTINLPQGELSETDPESELNGSSSSSSTSYETPVGKLLFPDYSPQAAKDDTAWMKRVYLYVGRYQRMTGEVKKLPKPLAIIQRRVSQASENKEQLQEELEIVEIIKFKLVFKNRPEPVNDA
ncbi:chromosome transmission fidelity protein 8 [Aspergillus unguis]